MTEAHEQARLDELTREEWFALIHFIKPELTEDEFDDMWERFLTMKRTGSLPQ